MAELIQLRANFWEVGDLTFLKAWMPGSIQRVFYIYGADNGRRAGHGHYETHHALVCLRGGCRVGVDNGLEETEYWLREPLQCLLLRPEDWHFIDHFSADTILMVMSNTTYDPTDYFDDKPARQPFGLRSCANLLLNLPFMDLSTITELNLGTIAELI